MNGFPTAPPFRPALYFQKFLDPGAQVYNTGVTVLATWTPAAGCVSLMPGALTIPGTPNSNVIAGMRFTFSDDTTDVTENDQATLTTLYIDSMSGKDGFYIKKIEFIVTSATSATSINFEIGVVTGFQI